MIMIDTLLVAIVLCVDTCDWSWDKKFNYADLQYDVLVGAKAAMHVVKENRKAKDTFFWHTKDVYLNDKKRKNSKAE